MPWHVGWSQQLARWVLSLFVLRRGFSPLLVRGDSMPSSLLANCVAWWSYFVPGSEEGLTCSFFKWPFISSLLCIDWGLTGIPGIARRHWKLSFPALGSPSACTGHLVGIAQIPETGKVEMFWALDTWVFSATKWKKQ